MSSLAQEMKEKVIDSVWYIIVSLGPAFEGGGTGVSVGKNLIVTCDHVILGGSKIVGRKLKDNQTYNLKIVHKRPELDMAVLKFEDKLSHEFESLNVSENQLLDVGNKLYYIGNPTRFVGEFCIGVVAYPCIHMDPKDFSEKNEYIKCRDHPPQYSLAREYAIFGDMKNRRTLRKEESEEETEEDEKEETEGEEELLKIHKKSSIDHDYDINSNLPIISCNGMRGGEGCSGGPLFREDGEVVGILACRDKFTHAVHVSALRQLLDEALEKEAGGSTSRAKVKRKRV